MAKKENPVNTTAETPPMPKYRERLRGRYADANPQTDQEWDDLAERGFAEDEENLKRYKDNEQVIQDILDSDKDANAVISEMLVNGTPFRAAVAKYFDPEDLVPKEGDADYGYYQKSAEERKKMGQEFRQRSDEKRANVEKANANIDAFCEKQGLDETKKEEFKDFINKFYDELTMLRLTPEIISKLYKAMTYDEAVAEAAENAEMDGKNSAIEAERVRRAVNTTGDGVPTPAGGSAPTQEKPKKKTTIFDDIPQRKF